MKRFRNFKATARAVGVMAAIAIFVGGVTFAALQTQQNVLAGNTIETATANLQLSVNGSDYGNSQTGFSFNNIIPGGAAVPATGHSFYLKNVGGTPLVLKLAVTSAPTNPSSVDLSRVSVLLTTVGSGSGPQTFSLQSLMSGSASGGVPIIGNNLNSAAVQQYKLQVAMGADAVNGSSAALGNIDFAFSGQAQSN